MLVQAPTESLRLCSLTPAHGGLKCLVPGRRPTAALVVTAIFRQKAVSHKDEIEFFRANPACWLLAAALVIPPALGCEASSASPNSDQADRPAPAALVRKGEREAGPRAPEWQAAPKPAAANRKELAAAFSKATPTSIADLKSIEQRVKDLVRRVTPAVVDVEVGSGSGSGVIISADGLVLTAGHVCGEPAREVRLTFADGKKARGKTLGISRDSDSGLIRITDRGAWPHAPVGDLEQARVGDWVLALGHPGGFDLKRSLVVRLGRIIRLEAGTLQTDCTISPGDSGGPLFDMYGRVIGIHSYISSSLTANFHVPITDFYQSWDQLVKGSGKDEPEGPSRAYVGASEVDAAEGCQVLSIDEKGPAFKAGLKVGDLVLKVEGRDIKAAAAFRRWVDEGQPGETLSLQIKRGDKLLSLEVKLEAPPSHN